MNGTVIDAEGYEHKFYGLEFDEKYESKEMPTIRIHISPVDGKGNYGQMRLTSDIDDPHYLEIGNS